MEPVLEYTKDALNNVSGGSMTKIESSSLSARLCIEYLVNYLAFNNKMHIAHWHIPTTQDGSAHLGMEAVAHHKQENQHLQDNILSYLWGNRIVGIWKYHMICIEWCMVKMLTNNLKCKGHDSHIRRNPGPGIK